MANNLMSMVSVRMIMLIKIIRMRMNDQSYLVSMVLVTWSRDGDCSRGECKVSYYSPCTEVQKKSSPVQGSPGVEIRQEK